MTNNESREAFEAWAQPAENRGYDLRQHPNGDYIFAKPQAAWKAWQARQPEIDALKARIAELEAQTQWQDISTAPKDGTPILVWITKSDFVCAPTTMRTSYSKERQIWNNLGFVANANITKWMLLPKPTTQE